MVRQSLPSVGYAAHFALTHLFWLGTYPAIGFLGRAVGVPATFSFAGGVALAATVGAVLVRQPHRPHAIVEGEA